MLVVVLIACKREFAGNNDFNTNTPVDVYGDNALLFSKIFRYVDAGTYLWFDIRNEIANFSRPKLSVNVVYNPNDGSGSQVTVVKAIDLRGRIYQYDNSLKELTVINYPLNVVKDKDSVANITFSFLRKQTDGCELITDATQRLQCERTYLLSLKKVNYPSLNLTLPVDSIVTYQGQAIKIARVSQDLYLTN